ncbi:MAG: carbohydrate ABC transporter permease [Chloroflexota bacterium]|nr:carbohydrate ABC transporter permease [Chloroflexota bacterium]
MAAEGQVTFSPPTTQATRTGMTVRQGSIRWPRLGLYALAIGMVVLMTFPLLWMVSTAFKGPTEIFTRTPQLIPSAPTFENFRVAFTTKPVGDWILNSTITATLTTLLRLSIAVPAAYVFARLRLPVTRLLLIVVIGTMIIPGVVTLVPNYLLVVRLGWINTWLGVIVPMAASSAFFIFLLRQHIMQIPTDLYDAAELDGAGMVRTLWDIVIPLIRPGLVAVAALSFLWGWNAYLWPLLVLPGPESQTLAVGLGTYASDPEGAQLWGPLMAVALISSLPPLLLFLVAQKHLATALTSGLKG